MTRGLRGQGTVELALGLTLCVPVMLIGWSFAEGGFLSLKATEAAESALWDSTSFPGARNLDQARDDAMARYADFDGRLSTTGVRRVGVNTQTGAIAIECTLTGMTMPQPALLTPVMPAPVGASCTARATTRLLAGGVVLGGSWPALELAHCSSGRPDRLNGACRGQPVLAMNDGALQDHSNCAVQRDGTACENREYFQKVEQLYDDTGGAQGKDAIDLVKATLNATDATMPLWANTALDTYLSSWGEDAPAMPFSQENEYPGDGDERRWMTTPFQQPSAAAAAYGAREACYLGVYCDSPSIERP